MNLSRFSPMIAVALVAAACTPMGLDAKEGFLRDQPEDDPPYPPYQPTRRFSCSSYTMKPTEKSEADLERIRVARVKRDRKRAARLARKT